jgi:hypothetical protein
MTKIPEKLKTKNLKKKESFLHESSVKNSKVFCTCCPTWEIKHPSRCSNTLKNRDKIHYFCTARCKEKFLKSPEKYTHE